MACQGVPLSPTASWVKHAGATAGVICNNIVPEWLRVVLLTALLLFVVFKTAKKGHRWVVQAQCVPKPCMTSM